MTRATPRAGMSGAGAPNPIAAVAPRRSHLSLPTGGRHHGALLHGLPLWHRNLLVRVLNRELRAARRVALLLRALLLRLKVLAAQARHQLALDAAVALPRAPLADKACILIFIRKQIVSQIDRIFLQHNIGWTALAPLPGRHTQHETLCARTQPLKGTRMQTAQRPPALGLQRVAAARLAFFFLSRGCRSPDFFQAAAGLQGASPPSKSRHAP